MKVQWLKTWSNTLYAIKPHLCKLIPHLKELLIQYAFCILRRITDYTAILKRMAVGIKPRPKPNPYLTESLNQTRRDLLNTQNYFNSVSDHNLVDCAIYQILANESKYAYLLKKARTEEKITVTPPYRFK